jgi:LPPG:FO 2-phospho-L-lactate transferase
MKLAVLAGGVGGAKLALGLYRVMDPADLTIIANTGDDIVMHGLHVSPDPDIMMYTLADVVNPETGWGFRGESFRVAEGLKAYGREVWFNLGDRDLATHIHRTAMLKEGATLSEALDSIRRALGLACRILPMTDSYVPTMLDTDEGRMHLQDYFVRCRCAPKLNAIAFENIAAATPAPGVLESLRDADAILVAPSNPLISIGPILAVPGIRDALRAQRERVIAICPLVGGKSLKGPSDKMMAELGHEVSAVGVAALYRDFCGTMIVDDSDGASIPAIESLGMRAVARPTIMRNLADKDMLARDVLRVLESRA